MSFPKTKSIREGLRKAAEARQAESDKLTTQQKLDKLPENGAKRQRARYLALLEKEKTSPAVTTVESNDKQMTKEKKALKEEQKRMKKENVQ